MSERTILKVGWVFFLTVACVSIVILWPEIYTAYNTHLRFRIDNLFSKNHNENNEDEVTPNENNEGKVNTNVVKEVQESSENQNSPNSGGT